MAIGATMAGGPPDTNTEGMSGSDIQAMIIQMIKDEVILPMVIDDSITEAQEIMNLKP